MVEKKFLYCYKMTHDTGFAPNPYHEVLTLATCKPVIRRCAKKGYWISGWASNVVQGKDKKYTDKAQKLIYLAEVSDVISFEEYWNKYPRKRQPDQLSNGKKEGCKSCGNTILPPSSNIEYLGDNIYEPDASETFGFKRHENSHHGEQNKEHDLSGKNVLICENYYYFGIENALEIKDKGFVVPRWKKFSMDDEKAKKVIDFVTKNYSSGINQKEI